VSRAPHGARGLKPEPQASNIDWAESRPPRGAWIETVWTISQRAISPSRAPHGARGLKQLPRCGMGRRDVVAPPTGRVD